MTTKIFDVNGSYTWTCPAGVTRIKVQCWGAGGGGGTPTTTTTSPGGGGGGGGGYAENDNFAVTPGVTYNIDVGLGGAAGTTGGGAGISGSISQIFGDGGTYVYGDGGLGGGNPLGALGGVFGTNPFTGIGHVGGKGGDGAPGDLPLFTEEIPSLGPLKISNKAGGGGGGVASAAGAGPGGTDAVDSTPGAGGGNGGAGNGGSGSSPGGGGGGGSSSGIDAGPGADGMVMLTYTTAFGFGINFPATHQRHGTGQTSESISHDTPLNEWTTTKGAISMRRKPLLAAALEAGDECITWAFVGPDILSAVQTRDCSL